MLRSNKLLIWTWLLNYGFQINFRTLFYIAFMLILIFAGSFLMHHFIFLDLNLTLWQYLRFTFTFLIFTLLLEISFDKQFIFRSTTRLFFTSATSPTLINTFAYLLYRILSFRCWTTHLGLHLCHLRIIIRMFKMIFKCMPKQSGCVG